MATSSIFANFTITNKKAAERFADVLDKAAKQPKWKPQTDIAPLVKDPDAIRAIIAKRNNQHE